MTQEPPTGGDQREGRSETEENMAPSEGSGLERHRSDDPEQLREEIRATREELGETVEALAHKADLKARAQHRVDERKEQLRQRRQITKAKATEIGEKVRQTSPAQAQGAVKRAQARARDHPVPTAAGGLAVGLLIGRLIGRRS
jgi:ElaB/YqjD/DUF883 family membrane-anchored ribosome-binding protein